MKWPEDKWCYQIDIASDMPIERLMDVQAISFRDKNGREDTQVVKILAFRKVVYVEDHC